LGPGDVVRDPQHRSRGGYLPASDGPVVPTAAAADALRLSAQLSASALQPLADSDWSVPAGQLEWDVRRTIVHMVGAVAKYTLYMASGSGNFIAVRCIEFEDAGRPEILASIVPVAEALANASRLVSPDIRLFHVTGPKSAEEYLWLACEEILVHTWDALQGFDRHLAVPEELARAVLAACYPGSASPPPAWHALIRATGRFP